MQYDHKQSKAHSSPVFSEWHDFTDWRLVSARPPTTSRHTRASAEHFAAGRELSLSTLTKTVHGRPPLRSADQDQGRALPRLPLDRHIHKDFSHPWLTIFRFLGRFRDLISGFIRAVFKTKSTYPFLCVASIVCVNLLIMELDWGHEGMCRQTNKKQTNSWAELRGKSVIFSDFRLKVNIICGGHVQFAYNGDIQRKKS